MTTIKLMYEDVMSKVLLLFSVLSVVVYTTVWLTGIEYEPSDTRRTTAKFESFVLV